MAAESLVSLRLEIEARDATASISVIKATSSTTNRCLKLTTSRCLAQHYSQI